MGDSIVKWAGEGSFQLQGGGETVWLGWSGLRLKGFSDRVRQELYHNPRPTTLIIHVGTNDIFRTKCKVARKRIRDNLQDIRNMLPQTRIIWSEILPRLFYYRERRAGAGNSVRDKLNTHAQKVCMEVIHGKIIWHGDLFPAFCHEYYRYDGVHLEGQGNFRLIQNFENALLYFNAFPSAFEFPPKFHGW